MAKRSRFFIRTWTPTDWGKTYHEVGPIEWLMAVTVLAALYASLDLYERSSTRV